MRLDLGGGKAPAPGHINIDICEGADIYWDLNRGLPPSDFGGGEKVKLRNIEGIRCHQVIEHLTDIIKLINDCFEVLKPGAEFEISTPYALSEQCWGDPTHKRGYTKDTFQYFVENSPFKKEQEEYGITARFELIRCEIVNGWNIEVVLRKPEEKPSVFNDSKRERLEDYPYPMAA